MIGAAFPSLRLSLRTTLDLDSWLGQLCEEWGVKGASITWNQDTGDPTVSLPGGEPQHDWATQEVREVLQLIEKQAEESAFSRSRRRSRKGRHGRRLRSRGDSPDAYMDLLRVPSSLQCLIDHYVEAGEFREDFRRLMPPRPSERAGQIYLCGAWSSAHSAAFGRDFLVKHSGVPAQALTPAQLMEAAFRPADWLILVSDSGETVDLAQWFTSYETRGRKWPKLTLITSAADKVLGENTQRRRGKVITVRERVKDDRSVIATSATINQVTVLYLLSLWSGHELGRIKSPELQAKLTSLARLPTILSGVRARRPEIRDFARRIVEPMILKGLDALFTVGELMPSNPYLHVISDPSLQPLLQEIVAKFIEHGPLMCFVQDSWNLKHGPARQLIRNRISPVLFLIGGLLAEQLSLEEAEEKFASLLRLIGADGKDLEQFRQNLEEKAFALVFSSDRDYVPLNTASDSTFRFREGHSLIIELDPQCKQIFDLEVALMGTYAMLQLIYFIIDAIGENPERIGILKTHTIGRAEWRYEHHEDNAEDQKITMMEELTEQFTRERQTWSDKEEVRIETENHLKETIESLRKELSDYHRRERLEAR